MIQDNNYGKTGQEHFSFVTTLRKRVHETRYMFIYLLT